MCFFDGFGPGHHMIPNDSMQEFTVWIQRDMRFHAIIYLESYDSMHGITWNRMWRWIRVCSN